MNNLFFNSGLNCKDLDSDSLTRALQICYQYHSTKIALNYNPEANHVTKNHCLVILEGCSGLMAKLSQEGYLLTLTTYGLVVSKL